MRYWDNGTPALNMEVHEYSVEPEHLTRVKRFDQFSFPYAFPGNVRDHLKKIANMKTREGDVLISTYPKSGTHWVREIVSMLVRGRAEYASDPLHSLDFYDSSSIDKLPSPRILQSHLPYRYLPNDIKKQGKIILVSRNPKDTAVSLYCMLKRLTFMFSSFSGSFHALLHCIFYSDKFPYGNWFDFVKDWDKVLRQDNRGCKILHLEFEDMKQDLKSNVRKISDFLELNHDEEFINNVAEKCTFKNMKNGKESNPQAYWKDCTLDGKMPIFRKGDVGDWRNWFSDKDNDKFDKEYARQMKDLTVTFQYSI
nr:estrogen sulfotransferase-like isoform X2 [Crassostrea virginica]XP_022332642.1 estrogen sulfotransferase-like isoform X2 [Crassostrea virginica]XP_022332643.1 estrogen sulfotransferase-like isoform X2 [Crassostrea virginica]